MKKQGIVTDYDGYVGTIKDSNEVDYLLLEKETLEKVNNNDEVIFSPEVVPTSVDDRNVARFVKKIKR